MFGLSRWEKFREHVVKSNLKLNRKQMDTLLGLIKRNKIKTKVYLVAALRFWSRDTLISASRDPPNLPEEQARISFYRPILAIVGGKLPEFPQATKLERFCDHVLTNCFTFLEGYDTRTLLRLIRQNKIETKGQLVAKLKDSSLNPKIKHILDIVEEHLPDFK